MINWEAIGAIGEIVGATAVVLTLAYLAKQMGQDAAATTSNSISSWLADYNGIILELTRDPDISKIVRQGLTNFDKLDPNDQLRVHSWLAAHMLSAQNLYLQAQDGTTHTDVSDQVLGFTATMLQTAGGKQWWDTARPVWRPEFVPHLDTLMKDTGPVTENWPIFNET